LVKIPYRYISLRISRREIVKKFILSALLLAFALTVQSSHAFEGDYSGRIEKELTRKGMPNEYSQEAKNKLVKYIGKEKHKINTRLKRVTDEDRQKELKTNLDYYDYALSLLAEDSHNPPENYTYARRVIYYVKASEFLVEGITFQVIKAILAQLRTKINYVYPEHQNLRLDLKKASDEATNLMNNTTGQYYRPEELKGMSIKEVAEQDISKDHALWNTKEAMTRIGNPWKKLEDNIELETSQYLAKKEKKLGDDFKFELSKARNILFFRNLKESASSAKLKARGPYGLNWKIKFGVETQTEPVASRLYAFSGGKYVDLTYSMHISKTPLTLILDKKKEMEEGEKYCDRIETAVKLVECFKKSKFKFALSPYIHKTGVVTKENAEKVLGLLPGDALKKYRLKKIIGRNYVIFNEVSVEFQGKKKFLNREGPVPMESMGSQTDRVSRGLGLFNLFIGNIDVKALNSKAVLYKDFNNAGVVQTTIVETEHDLGATLGSVMFGGKLNGMAIGSKFLKVRGRDKKVSKKLLYRSPLLFRPTSWLDATHSDHLWMAKKIAALTTEKIEEAVAASMWPDFMQKTFVYRIIGRRNHIAKLYGIENLLDGKANPAPTIKVDLSSAEKIKANATRYNLSARKIKSIMDKHSLTTSDYKDTLISKGKVVKCHKSILIGLLEDQYPTGLSRRVFRFFDGKELGHCTYGRPKIFPLLK
jgi:hypothetical protein